MNTHVRLLVDWLVSWSLNPHTQLAKIRNKGKRGHSWSLSFSPLCHAFQTLSFFPLYIMLLVALPFLFSPLLYCPYLPTRSHP